MADKFTAEQVKQISDAFLDAMQQQQKESDADRMTRIMSIKDPVHRQQQIEENIDLFKERLN